ncbi:MAG: hypothetical protein QCH99_10485 [Candidatus Bathyarchaeota archaeon]|nr:hypothetical protein [Candidatus Bathyarchaeum tardum]WGM88907.1 MAG: hypothetical protein NUK63_08290 [Candidatus Bathyarchaeum tardum]
MKIFESLAKIILALDEPGLEIAEVQSLQSMISEIKTYKSLLADYAN